MQHLQKCRNPSGEIAADFHGAILQGFVFGPRLLYWYQGNKIQRMGGKPMAHAEELVARILSGEKELFEEIVKQYQGLLYSIAYSILRDEMEAENVAQGGVYPRVSVAGPL